MNGCPALAARIIFADPKINLPYQIAFDRTDEAKVVGYVDRLVRSQGGRLETATQVTLSLLQRVQHCPSDPRPTVPLLARVRNSARVTYG